MQYLALTTRDILPQAEIFNVHDNNITGISYHRVPEES